MYPTIEDIRKDCSKGTVQKSSGLPGSICGQIHTGRSYENLKKSKQTLLSARKCQPDRSMGTLFFPGI